MTGYLKPSGAPAMPLQFLDPMGFTSHVAGNAHPKVQPIQIVVSQDVCSVSFLQVTTGRQVVGGGYGGKVRVWQTENGQEVETAISAENTTVLNIAASWDGKWVVVGTKNGRVIVWNAERREKVTEFQGHGNWVRAVDVSPDMSKIASGSDDQTVCVWSISSGERLLGPLQHDNVLAAVRFSPNGHLFATATWWKESIRIYNTRDGQALFNIPIQVNSYENQSLSWSWNSTLLFALSFDGDVKCYDIPAGIMLSHWPVYVDSSTAKCIVVANNGKFIAISVSSSVFFWDTATHTQIGPIIQHTDTVRSMHMSLNYDLAMGGGKTITLRRLGDVLPSYYVVDAVFVPSSSVAHLRAVANPKGSKFDGNLPNINDEYYLKNDLTSHVRRDSHDPVASGGFADIYRGILQTNRESTRVAIKAIRSYSTDDSNFFKKHKRLRREIKVWLTLKHTNVLPLLGTTGGFGRFPAMVCPWLDNGSLTTFLEENYDALSIIEILALLNDAASGLQYLHACAVVHGDLSGSNVLVCKNKRAYISDFGLSTLLTEIGGPTFATSVHERGTLRWTAPELLDLGTSEDGADSSQVVPTTHSDVYSFGGIMLQTLTGKVPYHYYTREAQVAHAVFRGLTPKRPSIAWVTDLRWVFIQQCWSTVNPSQSRPSSDDIAHFTGCELAVINTR